MSQFTGEIDHSAHDVATSLRERQVKSTTKMEPLRMINITL